MDIILEVVDTFVFDRCYATLLPETSRVVFKDALHATNQTSYIFDAFVGPGSSNWIYKPATEYFTFEPSQYAYMSLWPRDYLWRQFISLFFITLIFGAVVYFGLSGLTYLFVFDKETTKHPLYLQNQVRLEIAQAVKSMPLMALLTAPIFTAEVRGYSKLYDTVADGPGLWYTFLQVPIFLFFTDFAVYWIHRGLHHKSIYKYIHKPHHRWIMATPFASHAFHPLDGYAQGMPYHIFPFVLPLQKWMYVVLFIFVNVWTIMIHDGEFIANSPVINGAASHTIHHLYFNYNYGQYFTLWDRIGGSYRKPNDELFDRKARNSKDEFKRQQTEFKQKVVEVEGGDTRTFINAPIAKKMQ